MKTILLTNDDGFLSEGLTRLRENLRRDFRVVTVAPSLEQSAVSMSLTLNRPLKINQVDTDLYTVNGTPADCVNIGLQKVMKVTPDFVISGMNQGENLSEDIFFSGTCGGAFAAYLYNLPALAVSLISDHKSYSRGIFNYAKGVEITRKVVDRLSGFSRNRSVFNLNIPYDADGSVTVTRLGYKRYKPNIIERTDPRGNLYYWIGTGNPEYQGEENTDVWAVEHQMSSLSILRYDLHREEDFQLLKRFFDEKT